MLEVFNRSLTPGLLPLSCRRTALTLLLKTGDLTDTNKWRPTSLLYTDYKLLSKVLAMRLENVLEEVIHPDQTDHTPGGLSGSVPGK